MGSKQVFNPLSGSFDITYAPDGGEMFSDAGTPSEALGKTGDHYFDTTNTKLFGPKLETAAPTVIFTRNFSVADSEDLFDGDASLVAGQLKFDATTYAGYDIEVGYMGLSGNSTYVARLYITSFSGDATQLDIYGSAAPYESATNAELLAAVGNYVDIGFSTNSFTTNTMGIYLDSGTGSTLEISSFEILGPAVKWGNGYELNPNYRVNTLSGNETDRMPSVSAVNIGLSATLSSAQAAILAGKILAVSTKTESYSVLNTEDVILVDCTAGNIILSLPSAVGFTKPLRIKKIDNSANTIAIAPDGSQTIDGESSYVIYDQYHSVTLISNNSNWSNF